MLFEILTLMMVSAHIQYGPPGPQRHHHHQGGRCQRRQAKCLRCSAEIIELQAATYLKAKIIKSVANRHSQVNGLSFKIIVNNFANITILPVAVADPQGQGHQGPQRQQR